MSKAIENPVINPEDELHVIVDKKREIEDNETYALMLKEAYEAYRIRFIAMDRPTIMSIEKKTKKVLDNVVDELLALY
jgi:predicted esterase YcpF (UPF0227 family)